MTDSGQRWVRAALLAATNASGCTVVQVTGHTLAIVRDQDRLHVIDNRCPHMGFPLDRGSVKDGILTCHWHHARFDLCTGGTFDQWADDVRAYPVEIRDGDIWVDIAPRLNLRQHHLERLQVGLERDIALIIGKAVLPLLEDNPQAVEPFRIGLEFGTRYRRAGWSQGLTIHTCLRNLLPLLDEDDRPRAVFHGLSAVASDCDGEPPRFAVRPLPTASVDILKLKTWFRQFVEVRDAEGAERCIASAVRAGANDRQLADILFAAATDHRFIDIGHPLDFTNKALEALDVAGWDCAEPVLTCLVSAYASAERMEESNTWRHPVDLVDLVETAVDELPEVLEAGFTRRADWSVRQTLVESLLSDDPEAIVATLLGALRQGCSSIELAGLVAYAAALRIARFPVSNEFRDWDTALHTFTFANAVQQGLLRSESPELLRGVFDAAMSVYLDRFLNVPAVRMPEGEETVSDPQELLKQLPALLDQRHNVDEAGRLVARFLISGGDADKLLAVLGRLLLREDRDFHTIQMIEAAFRQQKLLRNSPAAQMHVLVAAVRYLAAHAPTMRMQEQTWRIAFRLHHGESLFETSTST